MVLLLTSVAFAQDMWVPGITVPDSVVAHLTEQGLDEAANIAQAVVPGGPFVAPEVHQSGGTGFCLNYSADLTGVEVYVDVIQATVTPGAGQLAFAAILEIEVNRPTDKFLLHYDVACVNQDCPGFVEPFQVDVAAPITLEVTTDVFGQAQLQANLGNFTWSDSATSDHIDLDCGTQTVENVLSTVGLSVYDIVLDLARDQVDGIVDDMRPDIEQAVEDAFEIANFETSIDLLGTTVDIKFQPSDVDITSDGVEVLASGKIAADQAACMVDLDPGGSPKWGIAAPRLVDVPTSTHAAVHLSPDLLDQGLYAIWRGGLLCQEINEGAIAGFSIDTSLLGLVGGEGYGELFPDSGPLTVRTIPHKMPRVRPGQNHDLELELEEFEIAMYADLDGRMAHVLGIEVAPDIGVDVEFSNTFGRLDVQLSLPETYNSQFVGDPIVPGAEDAVLESFESVVSVLVDSVVLGLLGDLLQFEVPAFEGYGLRDLTITDSSSWVTAEASVGQVYYNSTLDCGEGCTGSVGCATPGMPVSWTGGLLALVLLRRRP